MSNNIQRITRADGVTQGYHVGSDATPTERADHLTAAEATAVASQQELTDRVKAAQAVLTQPGGDGTPNDPVNNPMIGYSSDGTVKVEFWYAEEGRDGDFDDDDPDDIALLRFDAYMHRAAASDYARQSPEFDESDDPNWYQPQDSSYCTQVPYESDPLVVHAVARRIADRLSNDTGNGNWKRACEEMSWATPGWADPTGARP